MAKDQRGIAALRAPAATSAPWRWAMRTRSDSWRRPARSRVLSSAAGTAGPTGPEARAAGEDSPGRAPPSPGERARGQVGGGGPRGKVELMEWSAARYADWEACLRGVPVSEYGDPDRQFGYAYDERDGTGRLHARARGRPEEPAARGGLPLPELLAQGQLPKRRAAARRNRRAGLRATPPASRAARPGPRGHTLRSTLRNLERRVSGMKRSARRLLAASERFDEWESCVSWVPVTEYGDPDGKFGYLFGAHGPGHAGYRPALAIDRSDWDDPDYMFLALVGGDRPGRTCQDEPGEGVD